MYRIGIILLFLLSCTFSVHEAAAKPIVFFGAEYTLKKKGDSEIIHNYSEISDSKPVAKFENKKKKKRPRGVETVRFSSQEQSLDFVLPARELFFSYSSCHFTALFFSNEKRGPPAFLVS